MGEMKWIKIATDIFSDQKIMRIEDRTDADCIELIWIKLLALAGQRNNDGIFSVDGEPTSLNQFSLLFMRPLKKVKAAFQVLEQVGLIEVKDNVVTIPNWSKYQSYDKSEKDTTYHREYMRNYRKVNSKVNSEVNIEVNSEEVCETHKNKNIDIDINKKESKEKKVNNPPSEEDRKAYGPWKNVMLTDAELQVLQNQYPNWQALIDNFSEKIKAKGYTYANHCAAICAWEKQDRADRQKAKGGMMTHGYDYDAMFAKGG